MKQPDLTFAVPQSPKEFAAFVGKLQDILRDVYDNLQSVEVVDSAPTVKELDVVGDGKGGNITTIKILDDAAAGNRKIYYKNKAGTLRTITGT